MESRPGTSKAVPSTSGSKSKCNNKDDDWEDYSYSENDSEEEDDEYYTSANSKQALPSAVLMQMIEEKQRLLANTETEASTSNGTRRTRGFSPLRVLFKNEIKSDKNFSMDKETPYLAYDQNYWSPIHLYRIPTDITLQCIHKSGGEGVGRHEVGHDLMMDTTAKVGNRRVSTYIQNVCRDHNELIGQYQKMEGKVRSIRYFWKTNNQPERFRKLFEDFETFSGKQCPFKLGQVIKFPNENLNTLRVSDVTMKRFNDLLEMLVNCPVIVTIHRILKQVEDKEKAAGYNFSIDKKSLLKCIKALEHEKLLHLYETIVVSDGASNKVLILCHQDIDDSDSPIIKDHIEKTIDQYHKEGRVFPHGQLSSRYSVKKRNEIEKTEPIVKEEIEVLKTYDPSVPLSIENRFNIFRAMTARATVLKKEQMEALNQALESHNEAIDETGYPISEVDDKTKQDQNPTVTATPISGEDLDFSVLDDDVMAVKLPTDSRRIVKLNTSMSNLYGYQAKALRYSILHEIVYHFVYGHSLNTKPTLYEKFELSKPFFLWEYDPEPHVYVDEEGPLRFIPPLPPYEGIERGWFMLQDLIYALPLSVFILCAYIPKELDYQLQTGMLDEYLRDPIRRHTILGDLPNELRIPMLRDKKIYRQIEHVLHCLSAMGLMCIAQNPDPKRYVTAATTMFYVGTKGILYDTSTSEKGYATVSGPIEKYQRYDFTFKSVDDIQLFWHNLRAIVTSTPLSFRMDSAHSETSLQRHKKYSQGQMDKTNIIFPANQSVINLEPLEPHDGCAGFDSALFLHLKRHWDLNPRPSPYVSWFIKRFRTTADIFQHEIESRIECLTPDWNSFVKSMMPTDLDLTKSKKAAARSTAIYPSTRASISIEPKSKTRLPTARRAKDWKRKRPLDTVDIVSQENRIHIRSRFNAREKDMLILIRAIGFFLNPVYRFWLDPAVVRDIMHEFVPESRSKTVQSLMAAGVRELVRPHRLAYLQRIVRNLHTFPQMRELRLQLGNQTLSTQNAKMSFFRKAFDVANNLLFMDNQNIPSTHANDVAFDEYIADGEFTVSLENSHVNPIPLRSRPPVYLPHIHHCVAINVLLGILIHSSDGIISERILSQLNATVIHNALQVLRSDGLVSRTRALDPSLAGLSKNQAMLSYYFRHFFSHRFHPDILDQANRIFRHLPPAQPDTSTLIPYRGDHVGLVISASNAFYTNNDLEVVVDQQILNVFEEASLENAQQSTKQIRYLEHADLRLEEIRVSHVLNADFQEVMPVEELAQFLNKSHNITEIESASPSIYIKSFRVETQRNSMQKVYKAIKESGILGIKLQEIMELTKLSKKAVKNAIDLCLQGHIIIEVGVDATRWIVNEFRDAWCVIANNRIVYPKPWTLNNGEVCISTVRWMAESCLFTIVASPGVKLKDLQYRYEFALQPAAVTELISLLEKIDCVEVKEENFYSMEMNNPFEEDFPKVNCTYLLPAVDCVERFTRTFADVSLYPTMVSFIRQDDELDNDEEMVDYSNRNEVDDLNDEEDMEIDVTGSVNNYTIGPPRDIKEALKLLE